MSQPRLCLLVLAVLRGPRVALAQALRVPGGIDVAPWQALLEKHVDERGLVAYAAWQADAADRAALDGFIAAYARVDGPEATGAERIAALINAYNAMTIRWILQHYPTESIRQLDDSWKGARWTIGGRVVSLDAIEHQYLRPDFGWRVHATVVCAARSCPPLLRTAYTAANLHETTDRAYRVWLGREDLNQFDAAAGVVRISAIFKWYGVDFTGDGELAAVLERYAPPVHRPFLSGRGFKVEFRDYHWGLNDRGERGRNYRPSLFERLF